MFEKFEESGVEDGHVVVIVPPFFDCSQQRTIKEAGALIGVRVCRISSKQMPGNKPRGGPGVEPLSRVEADPQGEPCGGSSEPASEPILRAAYCLLQMADLLLQSGQRGQRSRVEGAKEKVGRVNVACQMDNVEEEPEEPAELTKTAAAYGSRGVALLKAKIEEEMEHWDVSSGYGSNVSSLDEE